jgi:hypothetical protein
MPKQTEATSRQNNKIKSFKQSSAKEIQTTGYLP